MFSFSSRKKTVELHSHLRRVADLTVPNLQLSSTESPRSETRYNRRIPVLICPWEHGKLVLDDGAFALAADLSDNGVGLVMHQPYRCCEVVVGFWVPSSDIEEPWYFLGQSHRNVSIGGGFWTLGVELKEFANSEHRTRLKPLARFAERLLPVTPANTAV